MEFINSYSIVLEQNRYKTVSYIFTHHYMLDITIYIIPRCVHIAV